MTDIKRCPHCDGAGDVVYENGDCECWVCNNRFTPDVFVEMEDYGSALMNSFADVAKNRDKYSDEEANAFFLVIVGGGDQNVSREDKEMAAKLMERYRPLL